MKTGVVLVAAGSGRRFGNTQPKQFLALHGEPLFMKSLRVFLSMPSVKEIIIVTLKQRLAEIERRLRKISTKKKLKVVAGGAYRGESVKNGLGALSSQLDVVLVHDAARPLVTKQIIRRVETAAFKFGAALAAWPLADTLKFSNGDGHVQKTIPRKNLWLAQTPQGFRRDIADACLMKPSSDATDDAELAERKGFQVRVVDGGADNFKVTFPRDLKLCRLLSV